MPKQKDLKRKVRARMQKTGESYTAARSRLVARKTASRKSTPAIPDNIAARTGLAERAGMSDTAVESKTGKSWAQWVQVLDGINAASLPHREIAKHLDDHYDFGGWWAQTVTVGYERIRGLREIGQRRGGAYEASKSKTVPVPVGKLYAAFTAPARKRWLGDIDLKVRTSTRNKSMRITWPDDTSLHVYFLDKGPAKSSVQVQHVGLPGKKDIDRVKAFWEDRLKALALELS